MIGSDHRFIDRHSRRYGLPKYAKTEHWQQIGGDRMKRPPVKLTARMRKAVEKAIRETFTIRDWTLLAINVRANHVHVVVAIGPKKPGIALNALKANATRHRCAPMDAGLSTQHLGPTKEASDTSGTNRAWRRLLTM